ncbi:MAG: sensor histidine kinase [Myxococcaceae bacterium]
MSAPAVGPLVLYVDDELSNRVVFEESFSDLFRIALADSGERALEMMAAEPAAVVVSDQRMPVMQGTELLALLKERYPDTVRIILTAYSDPGPILDAVNKAGASRFLVKPWERKEMCAVIVGALESFALQTKMRRLQLQMMDLQRLSTLGSLLGNVAHDMVSPLTAIQINCERLTDHAATLKVVHDQSSAGRPAVIGEGAREALEELTPIATETLQSVRYLNDLVTGIRSHSRPVSANTEADPRTTVLFAANLLRSVASERRVKLEVAAGELPAVRISPTGLCQLLINLLTNAVQAMDESRPARVVAVGAGERSGGVEFKVTDTGCGIPAALLERIGHERVTTKGADEGSGLGMIICREIVRAAGGTFQVESTEGVGTAVTFWLPAVSPS